MGATTIDTGTNDLLANLDGGILTLTLNRPEARNAMTGAMTNALATQLAWAEFERSVKCVLLTGAGKGFCAGGDVKGMAASASTSSSACAAICQEKIWLAKADASAV